MQTDASPTDSTVGRFKGGAKGMRSPGIEPEASAWKAEILPLNYKRASSRWCNELLFREYNL